MWYKTAQHHRAWYILDGTMYSSSLLGQYPQGLVIHLTTEKKREETCNEMQCNSIFDTETLLF